MKHNRAIYMCIGRVKGVIIVYNKALYTMADTQNLNFKIFEYITTNVKEYRMMGQTRKDIYPGLTVDIILKADQRTGKLTRGVVKDILTNSQIHTRGIKVRLVNGEIGRVQKIIK